MEIFIFLILLELDFPIPFYTIQWMKMALLTFQKLNQQKEYIQPINMTNKKYKEMIDQKQTMIKKIVKNYYQLRNISKQK